MDDAHIFVNLLCRPQPLIRTTVTGPARTFRLGLNRIVRDKKMGRKTTDEKMECLWCMHAAARDKKMGRADINTNLSVYVTLSRLERLASQT